MTLIFNTINRVLVQFELLVLQEHHHASARKPLTRCEKLEQKERRKAERRERKVKKEHGTYDFHFCSRMQSKKNRPRALPVFDLPDRLPGIAVDFFG